MNIKCFVIITISAVFVSAENVGWKSFLVENPTEFHDILLKWEAGNETTIPSWLSGVYIRNGPAQVALVFIENIHALKHNIYIILAHIWLSKKTFW